MKPGTSDDTHAHVARQRPAWSAPRAWRTAPLGGYTPAHGPRCQRSSLVLGVLVLAAVVSTRWVRVNVSPSSPYGLYRLAAVTPPLTRGTLVVLPVPLAVQRWHSAWQPLMKPVAAIEDDLVCASEEGLWIAGQEYGLVYPEAGGAPLPRLRGCVRVPAGAVFLASPAPRSLDGRYLGMTPVADLTARAMPLLTWRADPLTARDGARAERHADVSVRPPGP
jgi:type IV secretory pathway protease TraF